MPALTTINSATANGLLAYVHQHTVAEVDLCRIDRDMQDMPYFGFIRGEPNAVQFRVEVEAFRKTSLTPSFDPFDGSHNIATIAGWLGSDRNDALRFMMLAGATQTARIYVAGSTVEPLIDQDPSHIVGQGDMEIGQSARPRARTWRRFQDTCADYT